MSGRAKIDVAALRASTQPQPNPVEAANREDTPPRPQAARPAAVRAAPVPVTKTAKAEHGAAMRAPSRRGKSGVQFWTEPAMRKTLKLAALELDRSVDDIVNEAVAQWLARQGRA